MIKKLLVVIIVVIAVLYLLNDKESIFSKNDDERKSLVFHKSKPIEEYEDHKKDKEKLILFHPKYGYHNCMQTMDNKLVCMECKDC